jgi:hypothetical protein
MANEEIQALKDGNSRSSSEATNPKTLCPDFDSKITSALLEFTRRKPNWFKPIIKSRDGVNYTADEVVIELRRRSELSILQLEAFRNWALNNDDFDGSKLLNIINPNIDTNRPDDDE